MDSKVDINSLVSVGLSEDRKRLISEVLSLHVSLDKLLDELVKEKKITVKGRGNITFSRKVSAVDDLKLKHLLTDFNKIRNKCAHGRLDKKEEVKKILKACNSFISDVKSFSNVKFETISSVSKSILQAAVTTIFDDLASKYDCTVSRNHELDGFYLPNQKTLADEIWDVVGK